MSSDLKTHWQEVYGKDESRVSWYQTTPEPSLGLISENLKAARRGVLDVGAGASVLADFLVKAGLKDVSLLDISDKALAATRKRLAAQSVKPDFIVADITQWRPERIWGIWHDRAVFHFLVTDGARTAYLENLRQSTVPGSIAIIGTFAIKGPERCSGLPVQRYSPESLAECLGPEYRLVKSMDHIHATPAGQKQKFQFSVFERLWPNSGIAD